MSAPTRFEGDVHIAGALTVNSMTIPDGTITKEAVKAATGIEATKNEQQYVKDYTQPTGSNVVAEDKIIHTVYGATGTVVAFEAGIVTIPDNDRTATVDLHKNGASILTAAIVLDSNNTTYVAEAGTINTASLTDGDVLEVVVTIGGSSGTNPKGVFASCVIREKAQ